MHSADGLELVSRVEDRLHQQHVSRFDDVQTVGPGVERKEEDVDLFFVFEGTQVLLENLSYNHTKSKNIYISGSCLIRLSTTCVGLLLGFITAIQKCRNSNLEFVNPVDLRELHVVVKQGLRNDVQDAQPLCKKTNWVRSKVDIIDINLAERGMVYSYRGEDQTLGPGVGHLNLLQRSHYCFHFGRVASLTTTGGGKLVSGV